MLIGAIYFGKIASIEQYPRSSPAGELQDRALRILSSLR
jgi:hypothetical protein